MKASKQIKPEVLNVMNMAKCSEAVAKKHLKAQKGNSLNAILAAREEVANQQVVDAGNAFSCNTMEEFAKMWK